MADEIEHPDDIRRPGDLSPHRSSPRRDEYDSPDLDLMREPTYPVLVTTAGIVWIIFGSLLLLGMAAILLLSFGAAAATQRGEMAAGGMCVGFIYGLFGFAFLFVGVQSVRGTAADTIGNGIGSIVIGLLNLGGGVAQVTSGGILAAGIGLLCGTGLIVAGVLALIGRSDYVAWRRVKKAQKAQRQR